MRGWAASVTVGIIGTHGAWGFASAEHRSRPTDEFTEPSAAIRIVGVHVRKTGIGPDELQAIERIKHGDVAGLEPLVRKYQHEALRIAQVITRDRALSEDVVQQAFLQAFERRSSFDAERPFAPWFFRIVVNAAMKAATRRSRIFPLTSEDPSAGAAWGEAESELERAETAEDVRRALSRLSPRLRATVVLRYYLDLSEGEMAERLAVPRGTIKRRLHDARIRLRQLLAASRPG